MEQFDIILYHYLIKIQLLLSKFEIKNRIL